MMSLVACSSAQKQRLADREKLSASSGMLCDFVNGDDYQDIEVQLNLEMAKRCDPNKNFTTTDYKNASEVHGIVFCCALKKETKGGKHEAHESSHDDDLIDESPKTKTPAKTPEKPADKKEEPKAPAKPAEPAKAETKKTSDAKPASSGPSPASVSSPSAPSSPSSAAQPSQPAPQQKPPAKGGDKLGEGMESILDD